MKKLFYFTLILVMLISSISFAETGIIQMDDFEMQNGIKFGMSKTEVKNLLEGTAALKKDGTDELSYIGGTYLGYQDVSSTFKFENDKLYNFYYEFPNADLKYLPIEKAADMAEQRSVDVFQKLVSIYGDELNGVGDVVGTGGKALAALIELGKNALGFGGNYDTWIVEMPEGKVKIEHFIGIIQNKNDNVVVHGVSYQYFTQSEWDKAKQEQQ